MTEVTGETTRAGAGRERTRRPRRDVHGILLLDKPIGITSNAALQKVKHLFGARKAGHTGSLDPLASGLLPICFGEATKVSAYLLDADKVYRVSGRLGIQTDTGDAEGRVVRDDGRRDLDPAEIEAALAGFRGTILQVPPMYSARKHKGKRLYELARSGIEVEREARPVTIHRLELADVAGEVFTLEVRCSKGTYVRTLVEEIAAAAGTCAHVTALRRLASGPFEVRNAHTLPALEAAAVGGPPVLDRCLLPVDTALADWPEVRLGRDSAWYLRRGQPVTVPRAPARGPLRLYGADGVFLGIGTVTGDGRVAPQRLFRNQAG